VFRLFSTCKIESVGRPAAAKRRRLDADGRSARANNNDGSEADCEDEDEDVEMLAPDGPYVSSEAFFAKYLTNKKLMELEIRDSVFRRAFLVQFIITAQYHLLPCKFKG
jgi:hypothetical protein